MLLNSQRFIAFVAMCTASFLGGCADTGSRKGDGSPFTASKVQVRTVSGALKNTDGPVAVGAKTSDGRTLKAVMDPKTNRWSINLPKNVSAVISVKVGDTVKRLAFVRVQQSAQKPGDAAAEVGYEIPDSPFAEDADLGDVDWDDAEGDTIVMGDDEGEESIFSFIDGDLDGIVDLLDDDDDGDGVVDHVDEDWVEDLEAWLDEALWDFFEANDLCDLSDDEGAMCLPDDDEFFSEEACDGPDEADEASLYCILEGAAGFYDDADDWWKKTWEEIDGDLPANITFENVEGCKSECYANCDGPADVCETECDTLCEGGVDLPFDDEDTSPEGAPFHEDEVPGAEEGEGAEDCAKECSVDCGDDFLCIGECIEKCAELP